MMITARARLAAAAILPLVLAASPAVRAQEIPSFLKPYYAPLFALPGEPLQFNGKSEAKGITHYEYSNSDKSIILAVENFPCQTDVCRAVYTNAAKFTNERAGAANGAFRTVTDAEFRVDWNDLSGETNVFVFRLPTSVQFWTYTNLVPSKAFMDASFDQLKSAVNLQRFEEAFAAGNVEFARWNVEFREYYKQLLNDGHTDDALVVLQNLIATAPFELEAQMDFAERTADVTAAHNSAQAVLTNAESPELLERAARFLNVTRPTVPSLPLVSKNDSGLQVILVPLGRADVGLLTEAGKIYEGITGIPTKLQRLPSDFPFVAPERIADQKAIQQMLIQKLGPNVDFAGWNAKRYGTELMQTVAANDPLARFQMQSFVDQMGSRPGQYLLDTYLIQLGVTLEDLRSSDRKVIYVGVTDANIYSGDLNYVFSAGNEWKGGSVGIASYAMMIASANRAPYESRKRLAERLAKDLVPVTLEVLNIPRPADPTDPYSYANSIQRLDEKTLQLSQPTKDAIAKFR